MRLFLWTRMFSAFDFDLILSLLNLVGVPNSFWLTQPESTVNRHEERTVFFCFLQPKKGSQILLKIHTIEKRPSYFSAVCIYQSSLFLQMVLVCGQGIFAKQFGSVG